MQTQLYFWKPLMKKLQKELSLVEEYYNRTKVQFDDIENEADDYADSLFNEFPATEDTDPSAVAEWATEQGIELYEILSIMKSNHLLMTISMLYHIWEQQLIKFTTREIDHYLDLHDDVLSISEVYKVFEQHGVKITDRRSWSKIEELKLLVNTIKHGDGYSAENLRKVRPDFFELDVIKGADTLKLHKAVLTDEYSLQVKEMDLYDYIKATMSFWDDMPERVYSDTSSILKVLKTKK